MRDAVFYGPIQSRTISASLTTGDCFQSDKLYIRINL
jgi:hypothetical protein